MKRALSVICSCAAACSGGSTPGTTTDNPPDNPPDGPLKTVVSLTFDDTRADQYQAGAMVAARQMRATFFVNSSRIGSDGYMTVEQLRTLEAAGNEIAGHTLAHVHLQELDSDQVQHEICDDRVALLKLGFKVTTFAYPFGNESPGVERIAEMCGYNAARDSAGLALGTRCVGCPQVESVPPSNPYKILAAGEIKPDTTLEQLEEAVINAENAGGGWVPFVFHHICDGCATNAISPATLTAFIDWLAERKELGTGVRTMSEVFGGAMKPAVPAPRPGINANLIKNASLERDADPNVPDCWQQRSSGTNDGTFASTSDAYDGAFAQQIAISSYISGTRRLMTRPECPLPAQAGHSYRITAWYKSDASPRFSVNYQNTAGTWMAIEQSDPLPPAAVYTQAVHTTPVLPSDAIAISIGLGINAVGSITMDAFDTVDAAATDNPPPAVTLTGPASGAAVSNTATLAATASDSDGIARVDFRVNDLLLDWDDTEPFSIDWSMASLAKGSYVITARAFDRTGTVTTSQPLTITIGPQ